MRRVFLKQHRRFLLLLCCVLLSRIVSAQNFDFCNECFGTTGECAFPAIEGNPDLTALCSELDIILIIDESGSIQGFERDVKQGVLAFVTALLETGVDMAVIEFDSSARLVSDYTAVSSSFLTKMNGYFDSIPFNGQTYVPFEGTNWMKAMQVALELEPADLILFFTDGNPTVYTTDEGIADRCGNGFTTQRPEIVNPMLIANYAKATEGTHMFMMGVGLVDSVNLERMSGSTRWGQGSDFQESDYALGNFETLADELRAFAIEICGTEAEIVLPLSPDSSCIGEVVQFTFQLSNPGLANPAQNVVVRDTFPPGFTDFVIVSGTGACLGIGCNPNEPPNVLVWTTANILPQGSATLVIQATVTSAGNLVNSAWVSGQNIDLVSTTTTLFAVAAPVVTASDDQTICEGQSAILNANATGGFGAYGFDWSTNENSNSITVTPLITTNYTVTVTDEFGCFDTDQVQVNVQTLPDVNLADRDTSCQSGPIVLNPGGNTSYTYLWSPAEFLDNPNSASPIATIDESTTFFVTITDGVCIVMDMVDIVVRQLPNPEINNADTSCFGAPLVLNPGGAQGFTYAWSPAEFLSNPFIPSPTADINQSTLFIVTITDQSNEQCQSVDSVFVFVPPDVDLGAPEDTSYCVDGAITLTATGTGLEFTWFTSLGQILGTGPMITLEPEEETTYILEGRDSFGCEVQTTVTLTPAFLDYTPSVDQQICIGETIALSIQNNDPGQTLTYIWTPPDGIIGSNTLATIIVSPQLTITYTVQITNELGCIAEEMIEVQVSQLSPPFLMINVEEDTISLGESFVLSTNQDPDLFYFWDGPGITTPNLPIVTGTPGSSGIYTYAVTVTNTQGCELSGSISNLIVRNPLCTSEDVFIPDAFSPNNDGDNDILQVYGNYISELELRIFNRWGEQVFVSNDQGNGWDGTYNGKELAPDVFGYYLRVECPPDKTYFTKGNITLFK